MQTWLDVLSRGLAMLLTATALGIGTAAFLGRRFDPAARLAIAPAIGLCLGRTRWRLDPAGGLHVCIRATGTAPVGYAGPVIVFNRVPTAVPDESFAPMTPLTGVRLTSMLVSDLGCTGRGLHA